MGENQNIPRLCGGIFYNLLIYASKDSVLEYVLLEELVNVFTNKKSQAAIATKESNASEYKKCEFHKNSKFLPFLKPEFTNDYFERIENDYASVLSKMDKFVKNYIDPEKKEWLFYALVEILYRDKSLNPTWRFFISPSGSCMSLNAFPRNGKIVFESFLLGIWTLIIENINDTRVGIPTFEAWTIPNTSNNRPRIFNKFDLGSDVPKTYTLVSLDDVQEQIVKPINNNSMFLPDIAGEITEHGGAIVMGISPELYEEIYEEEKDIPVNKSEYPEFFKMLESDDVEGLKQALIDIGYEKGKSVNPALDYIYEYVQRKGIDKLESEIQVYFEKAKRNFSKVPTLINLEPQDFRTIYECCDIDCLRSNKAYYGRPEDKYKDRSHAIENPTAFSVFKEAEHNHVILCGTGGIGKSMMLTHFLFDAIDNYEETKIVPFIIRLREYKKIGQPIREFIPEYLHEHYKLDWPMEIIDELARANRLLIMFDGIDEIITPNKDSFDSAITSFFDNFEKNYCIMTTRPEDVFGMFRKYRNVAIYEILPLTLKQAQNVIMRLVYNEEHKLAFVKALEEKLFASHQSFAEIPLLLNIMFLTQVNIGTIPNNLTAFYDEAYRALAYRHDSIKDGGGVNRKLRTGLTKDRFADYFSEFCARTYFSDEISHDFTEAQIEQIYKALNFRKKDNCNAECLDFIKDASSGLCLLILDGMKYRFTHRSFEEYFCARFYSLMDPKKLYDVGMKFEKKSTHELNDKAFDMLYELRPSLVEQYIFIPFLEKIIFSSDDDDENYRKFLIELYGTYYFGEGEDWLETEINITGSYIYEFFIKLFKLDTDKEYGPEYIDEAFLDKQYVHVSPADYPSARASSYETSDFLLDYEDLNYHDQQSYEICGWTYTLDFDVLFSRADEFTDTIDAIMKEDFDLREEYLAVKSKYEELKKKFDDASVDIFDLD